MDSEDCSAILWRRQVDKHGRESTLANLLGRELAHIVCSRDDEHPRMGLGEPAQQRAHHTAGGSSVCAGRRSHPADGIFVLGDRQYALGGGGDLRLVLRGARLSIETATH
jgi:hypothetical protein